MEPARSEKILKQPHTWFQFKNGPWVKESIQIRIDEWCPKLFGYHMLKLGGLSCELATCNCNIQHQVYLDVKNPLHTVIADSHDLPFLSKSIDTVILAHQLEYSNDPHRMLREVDRVIVDDGYIIVSGFNPISVTGLLSLLPWRKKNLPWSGRMFTANRIRDWLGVLNYQVLECEQYGFFPMQNHGACCSWIENSLGSLGKNFGSLYFIVARKRTYPLKLIKPHWHFKRKLSPVRVNCRVQSLTIKSATYQSPIKS
jgi:SAM-dependent methyltransferase